MPVTSVAPTIVVSLAIAVTGVWLFVRDVRTHQLRRRSATSQLQRSIVRLERWRFGSLGIGVLLGIAAMEATMRHAPAPIRFTLFGLVGLAVLIGFIASIAAGWREGQSRDQQ